jgi:hypothetical protein
MDKRREGQQNVEMKGQMEVKWRDTNPTYPSNTLRNPKDFPLVPAGFLPVLLFDCEPG